jgi:hypothetical protein
MSISEDSGLPSQVHALVSDNESATGRRLGSLIRLLGLNCKEVSLNVTGSCQELLSREKPPHCVILSNDSLTRLSHDAGLAALLNHVPYVLVYGVSSGEEEIDALKSFTGGLVSSARQFEGGAHSYSVNSICREITREFAGLEFGPVNRRTDGWIPVNSEHRHFSSLISIDRRPFFARIEHPGSSLFLLACNEFVDVGAPSNGTLDGREYFSHLVPVVMFLRCAFPHQTWNNPNPVGTLIIDDPLLRQSYGFLNYKRLLEQMDRDDFSSTIAFIPWNYKRSKKDTANLIKARADRFSICVHGCDHTDGEFATSDSADLIRRVSLATQRMDTHRKSVGVAYADVMVFPQGKFSSASLYALKRNNYLGAVNSSVLPDDLASAHGLTLGDLLVPAITKYHAFPLFMRRYPGQIVDVALDLFMGKAALFVEHHRCFKDGYETIGRFMAQVHGISPGLRWVSLEEALQLTYLQKDIDAGKTECKLFATRQSVRNATTRERVFEMVRADDGGVPIQGVTVDGRSHQYKMDGNQLRLSVAIPPNGTAEVAVHYQRGSVAKTLRTSLRESMRVYIRRHLSEVRDNYIARNEALLALAYRLKNQHVFVKRRLNELRKTED